MLRKSFAALTVVLMALATPAFADLYTFKIDESQSIFGFFGGFYSTVMGGTFTLKLDGSSSEWSGNVEMESVDAVNLTPLVIPGVVTVQTGDLKLTDFDRNDDDSGSLSYDGVTHIASGIVNTEVYVDVTIEGLPPIEGWQPEDLDDQLAWTVEVSDDDWLQSAEPGWTPEARLTMSDIINVGGNDVPFTVTLVGAVVPEPATMTLLLGGMLMILPIAAWRRRRR